MQAELENCHAVASFSRRYEQDDFKQHHEINFQVFIYNVRNSVLVYLYRLFQLKPAQKIIVKWTCDVSYKRLAYVFINTFESRLRNKNHCNKQSSTLPRKLFPRRGSVAKVFQWCCCKRLPATNHCQRTRERFPSISEGRDLPTRNLGATFATVQRKLAEATVGNRSTTINHHWSTCWDFSARFRGNVCNRIAQTAWSHRCEQIHNKNHYQSTRRGFHSRFQGRGFQAGNLRAMFAIVLPKLPEVTVANRFTAKIVIKAPVVASVRDFKAKIFKQVTWGQCLQPYGPNCLKPLLRTDSPQKIIIKAHVGASIRDLGPRFSSR